MPTESNIPGVKLISLIDSYTMAELEWWLFMPWCKSMQSLALDLHRVVVVSAGDSVTIDN